MQNPENSDHFVPALARHSLGDGGRLCAFVPSKSGFSLVEVSLALLIVGVAMLTILGLFPAGLEQNARSIGDTRAALFAEEVCGALRVHAETNWPAIGVSIGALGCAASNNWDNQVSLAIRLNNKVQTNIYRHPDNTNLINHALRYRAALATNGAIKALALRVWTGQYGTTNNPAIFYAEFYRSSQ